MKLETVPIASLSNDPANARKHNDRNIELIIASLRRFGQQKPIVVDKQGVVRAGNGTLEAARRLGMTDIIITRSKLTASEMTAYAIVDNRSAELAEWDNEILAGTLSDPDIGDVGFTDEEIAGLEGDAADPNAGGDEDSAPADKYMVLVTCPTEADQVKLLADMQKRGWETKSLIS